MMFQEFQEQQTSEEGEAVAVVQVQVLTLAVQVVQGSLLLTTQQAHLLHQAVGI
jgi:hypothetical protein